MAEVFWSDGQRIHWYFVVVLAFLVLANVAGYRTRANLQARLGLLRQINPSRVEFSQPLQPLEGLDETGKPVRIAYEQSATVLIVMQTAFCPECASTMTYWNTLAEFLQIPDVRFAGLFVDPGDADGYLMQNPAAFPIIRDVSREILENNGIVRAPLTIVVSRGGEVVDYFTSLDNSMSRNRLEERLRPYWWPANRMGVNAN